MEVIENYWAIPVEEVINRLGTSIAGVTDEEAIVRFRERLKEKATGHLSFRYFLIFLSQYKSPLVLILVFASCLAFLLGEYSDGIIILVILLSTGLLSYIQERKANQAVERLRELVRNKVIVRRQGDKKEINAGEVVQGDIIILDAGDIIPADSIILEANNLHINESILTGESYPSEKFTGISATADPVTERKNIAFKGTNVISGSATIMAVYPNKHTELDKVTTFISQKSPDTAFEKGIRKFGFLLVRISVIIALLILTTNILLKKPVIDSMLFTLALTVGMSPELLPAIITVTLSMGAKRMAAKKVIVKKLSAIQNLGEMDILCADKTGTLTEGKVSVHSATGYNGKENSKVLEYAYLNALFETGFSNPIDETLRSIRGIDVHGISKKDEVPYDFIRKRLSVIIAIDGRYMIITKGAVANILQCCKSVEVGNNVKDIDGFTDEIQNHYNRFSEQGLRTIGICYKDIDGKNMITKKDETDMIFLGFVVFFDPPKEDILLSLERLTKAGIKLKLISGDNRLVVRNLAEAIGLDVSEVVVGADLIKMSEDALSLKANHVEIFAEIEPMQKERIIKALQKSGHAVGFLGDGINDAGAIKSADIGISVESGADIAKEVADIVLLDKSIEAIREGVLEGRKTFTNTLKYVFITTSANFGNMLSMAVASLILPFLPLLASQVLLNNFLSDIPAMAIGTDNVDDEALTIPKRWNMADIGRFMIIYGLQSSIFDVATFVLLLYYFHTDIFSFRTAWFEECLISELLILFIIRTKRKIWNSKPGKWLLFITTAILVFSILLPYLPFSSFFGLYPIAGGILAGILLIAVLYLASAEGIKRFVLKAL